MSPTFYSFEVRTPRIHLIVSPGDLFYNLGSRGTSYNLITSCGHYWVILEYLLDRSVLKGENVPFINLLDVLSEREMTLDYGNAEWPRELRVCSNDDIISITYSSRKPVEGLEYII